MRSFSYKLTDFRSDLVVIALLLFVSRMAFPGLKYLFVPAFALSLIPFLRDIQSLDRNAFFNFFKNFWQFLIVGLFICSGIILTFKILILPFKEFVNFFIFLIFLIQLYFLSDDFQNITNRILNYFIFLSIGIAVIGLFNFFYYFNIHSTQGTSIVSDNNFYALFSAIGIIAISYNCISVKKNKYTLDNIFLSILFLNMFFSFSRRGVFIIILFVLILTALLVSSLIRKSYYIYFKKFRFFWVFTLFFSIIFVSYVFIPPELRKRASDVTGIRYFELKTFSNTLFYQYSTIFTNKLTYSDIREQYFYLSFDPNDPATWGTRKHKVIFPLTGDNVEIVPSEAMGYMLDSTSNASTWKNNAYSYSMIGNDSVKAGDIINASVFCYVSPDYNGTWVRLSTEETTMGNSISLYDLSRKGTWQKLSVTCKCKKGIAPAYLFFSKYGVTDFSSLKGHVIFAFPQYRKVTFDPNDPATWGTRKHKAIFPLTGANVEIIPSNARGYMLDSTSNASTWNNSAFSYTLIGNDSVSNGDLVNASVYCYVSEYYNGTWVRLSAEGSIIGGKAVYYDLAKKGTWQKLTLIAECKKGTAPAYLYLSKYGVTDFSSLKGHVIFAYPQYQIIDHANFSSLDKDLKINSLSFVNVNFNWLKKILINDSYINNDTINLDQILATYENKELSGSRLERWYFAWYLFKNEYRWYEKIFGGGFKYLEKFGEKFFPDEERLDYPHNPIISSFLYSGIIGGLFYIYFLILTFWYYWKYRKHHMVFFIMYLVTFFFAFFSGNSHFSIPIFAFLSFIPFMTRYVVKEKGDKNLVEKKPE